MEGPLLSGPSGMLGLAPAAQGWFEHLIFHADSVRLCPFVSAEQDAMSFIDELKRRNVFRVGIAYALSAWVVLQVVDLILDNTDTPDWVMDVIMTLALLGFFVALVISWAYELTPEGVKRDQGSERHEVLSQHAARKLNHITLAAVGLVVMLFVFDRFVLETPVSTTALPDSVQSVASDTPSLAMEAALATSDEPDRGVAVLPFENLSEDPANAFFAGGVHEDVLTHLSRIGGLRIISRTSMIKIAERGLDVPEIGRQLGVSHVLEGSVRRAGDQVRVTVQLIEAATDNHLWAENFDRRLDDIFAIQSEIAQSIAAQLKTELSPEEISRIAQAPTDNLEAYDLYLKARELNRSWLGADGFDRQRVLLEQAVAMAPDFLDAQDLLLEAYGRLVWTGSDPEGIYRKKAKALVLYIEKTWPNRPEAGYARARYAYTVERDYETALAGFMTVLPHLPNNVDLLLSIASSHKRLAQFDQGLVMIIRAESLDPEHATIAGEKAMQLIGSGKIDEGIEHLRASTERFPEDVSLLKSLAAFQLGLKGDIKSYLSLNERAEALNPMAALFDIKLLRIRLDVKDLDSTIESLDALRTDDAWLNSRIDSQAAELLNLAGREDESAQRARRALAAVENRLSSGFPLPGNTPKLYYSEFAYWACLAGDGSAFNRYRAIADAMRASEIGMEQTANGEMALALAECGDAQAGWIKAQDSLSDALGGNEWEMVLDPIYPHYFSDLPEYQAWVAAKRTRSEQAAQ